VGLAHDFVVVIAAGQMQSPYMKVGDAAEKKFLYHCMRM